MAHLDVPRLVKELRRTFVVAQEQFAPKSACHLPQSITGNSASEGHLRWQSTRSRSWMHWLISRYHAFRLGKIARRGMNHDHW